MSNLDNEMVRQQEEKFLKEDHDNGECGCFCKWCYVKYNEFMAALIPPTPGYIRSGNTFKG